MWVAYYQHLKEVAGVPAVDPRTPLEKGLDHFNAGEHAEALACLEAVAAAQPEDVEAHRTIGRIHLAAGRHEAAYQAFARASVLAENDAKLHYHLGECLQALGRLDEAEEALRTAIALAPALTDAHIRLGMLLVVDGRKAEALESFDRAVYMDRRAVVARFYIAQLCIEAEDYPRALVQLAWILKVEPDHPPVYVALGSIFERLGDHRQVIAEFGKVVSLGLADAALHHRIGQAYRPSASASRRSPPSSARSMRIRATGNRTTRSPRCTKSSGASSRRSSPTSRSPACRHTSSSPAGRCAASRSICSPSKTASLRTGASPPFRPEFLFIQTASQLIQFQVQTASHPFAFHRIVGGGIVMTNKPEDARSSLSLSAAIPGSAWQMETRPAAVVAATITAERAARVRREAAAALANLLEVQDGEPRLKAPVDDAFMVVSSLLAELRATSVA